MHNFTTSGIGHLENIVPLSYAFLLNVDTLNLYQKIIYVNITTDVIRKVSCQSNGERYNFLLKNSNFITGNNYCQFFFLKWQTHFVHSGENVCQIPRL